ncbi:MAG: hypothetical protein JWP74_3067 [Marmoricola sp.]|nr:hypothetical protein [Marmoricola sp.]
MSFNGMVYVRSVASGTGENGENVAGPKEIHVNVSGSWAEPAAWICQSTLVRSYSPITWLS